MRIRYRASDGRGGEDFAGACGGISGRRESLCAILAAAKIDAP